MSETLVHGKYLVCEVPRAGEPVVIEDGALHQKDGVITDIGTYADLKARHPDCELQGSGHHIVFPGLVNSHHHGGLLAFQMGTRDMPLEQWTIDRLRRRNVDPYLDTLYAAFEMIESGVTTVQHLHSRASGPLARVHQNAQGILKAYEDVGMRVSYSFGIRDQNRVVYQADEAFLRTVPSTLAHEVKEMVLDESIPLEDQFALFRQLYAEHAGNEARKIQLAASNLQWCSDDALLQLKDHAQRYGVPVHMHLLETGVQAAYARRRTGRSAVAHLHALGLLGPMLTLGHMVWPDRGDIDLLADTGTHICHNPSSNLRLRSGVAPVPAFVARGIAVSLGMDDASLNDDRNLLHEMRLALRLHASPDWNQSALSEAQVLRMATTSGAATTPFGAQIGSLGTGKAADMVVMDWNHIAHPYLDEGISVVEALVHLGRASGIQTVMIAGEQVFRDGRFTRIDKAAAMAEFAQRFQAPLSTHELRRQRLAESLAPHVKQFYADAGFVSPTHSASHGHTCPACGT